ncbi:7-carboxy-7-deazaguanine synthase QueE [Myxococcota bacterium]|nr:7-carboxy-7-deazaguanine synthase QueE [Myxococcota bacterium]
MSLPLHPDHAPAPEERVPKDHGARADRLRITEIFFSLQGESSHQGLPCIFVRLTGCNLRCVWCDTEYSFTGGETMTIDEVLARVAAYPSKRVELTGGEPLLQRGAPVLAAKLLERGYTVLCETSGERDIDLLPPGVLRIVDLKAPGSGEVEQNRWSNLDQLRAGDELKIVLADRADYEWARDVIRSRGLERKVPILLAPVQGQLEPRLLAEWILADGIEARLNLQQHKLLWGNAPGH